MHISADKYLGTKDYLLVYGELITAARYRGVTTYQAIAQLMGLPLTGNYMSKELGQVLGEIAEAELDQGRPMLSAVAVGVSGRPGPGFFALARQLRKLTEESPAAEEAFWIREREAVYLAWRREFKA
jgi:hypothetical protein